MIFIVIAAIFGLISLVAVVGAAFASPAWCGGPNPDRVGLVLIAIATAIVAWILIQLAIQLADQMSGHEGTVTCRSDSTAPPVILGGTT